jgi:hypothetical protein
MRSGRDLVLLIRGAPDAAGQPIRQIDADKGAREPCPPSVVVGSVGKPAGAPLFFKDPAPRPVLVLVRMKMRRGHARPVPFSRAFLRA